MADKTPVRVVFNASNVATGMAEFQSGESVPVANGGTGLTAVGSAGQVLKVNGAGNGLEFGAEGDISITNLVAPTNADLTLTTSGTGNIILDAITVRGTTISSADSSTININDNVEIDGNLVVTGTVDFNDQNISNVGSLSIDSISGDADTNTSITFSGSDVITIATGGAGRLTISDGALAPVTDNQIDLGTSNLEFKDAFFTGTVTSDAFAGPLTGNVTGTADVATTVTVSDNESTNESNVILFAAGAAGSGNLGVEADGNMTYNPSTGKITATGFVGDLTGTASAAQYSDVAERFASDSVYAPGTVVALGGAEEITQVNEEASDEVFGVVSSLKQAAFKMNAGAGSDDSHPFIAMTGRVDVKVIGTVNKGDRLVSASVPGYARAATKAECTAFNVIGRALTGKTEAGQGSVLAAVRVSH